MPRSLASAERFSFASGVRRRKTDKALEPRQIVGPSVVRGFAKRALDSLDQGLDVSCRFFKMEMGSMQEKGVPHHRRLWLLAGVSLAAMMTMNSQADEDDPYLWLEEVSGASGRLPGSSRGIKTLKAD